MLVCLEGPLTGQRWEITAGGLRIGRDPGNEVHIEDSGISRQHARVLLHNGAVWVQDAGSRNGIFVNGERVPDHRQVKVGDRLTVGTSTFQVASASTSMPIAGAPPRPRAAPRWKIWPFAVAVVFALGIIGCFTCLGSRGDGVVTNEQPAYSLSTALEAPPAGGSEVPVPSVEQALAVAAGADATGPKVPDPPPGSTAASLSERAQGLYDAGRINDAVVTYQMALKLDASCEICKLRVDRLQGEIAQQAQQHFDAGMRYYDSMQLASAVSSWETVLQLVPDPADPMHVRAKEYLEKARAGATARP